MDDLSPEEMLVTDPEAYWGGRGVALKYVHDELETAGIAPSWDETGVPLCARECPQFDRETCHIDGTIVCCDEDVCQPAVRVMYAELARVLVSDDDRR